MNYKLLLRLVFLFYWWTALAVSTLAQTEVPQRQLTLIRPGDSGFDALLSENFPGLEKLDGYAVYRPFLVLLRNDTPHAVRAYMLQWQARSLQGATFQLADRIERNDPAPASERATRCGDRPTALDSCS